MAGPRRWFVVVTGIPGSGKTTLAHLLSRELKLPVIDKDDILESLFVARGTGDDAWRRALSRESDAVLQRRTGAEDNAILSSFWHVGGMRADSGTRSEWLADLHAPLLQVHCVCDPATAAERFASRQRHPGHLDGSKDPDRLKADIAKLAALPRPSIGECIEVDTNGPVDVHHLAQRLYRLLENVPKG